jgi:predicted dehydrogenase
MTIKLAVIGAGDVAPFHLDAFQAIGVRFFGIAASHGSERAKNLGQRYDFSNIFSSWQELVEGADEFDALLLCTPPTVSELILRSILPFKKKILVEKPVTISLDSMDSLLKKDCSNVSVAFNRRYYESVIEFKKSITNQSGHLSVSIIEDNFSDLEKLRESLFENSVHIFDILNFVFGPISINSVKNIHAPKGAIGNILDDTGNYIGDFKIKFGPPENSEILFSTDKSSFLLKPIEKFSRFNTLVSADPTTEKPIRAYIPQWSGNGADSIYVRTDFKPGFLEQAKEFVNQVPILDRKLSTMAEARRATMLADSIYKSIASEINHMQ